MPAHFRQDVVAFLARYRDEVSRLTASELGALTGLLLLDDLARDSFSERRRDEPRRYPTTADSSAPISAGHQIWRANPDAENASAAIGICTDLAMMPSNRCRA